MFNMEMPMKTTKQIADAIKALEELLGCEYGTDYAYSIAAKNGMIACSTTNGVMKPEIADDPMTEFKYDPTVKIGYGGGKNYKDGDLLKFAGALAMANAMANSDAKTVRDEGTCVLGAGVAVEYIPPKCRKPVRKVLIRAPFQGNVASYNACKRAAQYLRSQGLDCYWYDGVMD